MESRSISMNDVRAALDLQKQYWEQTLSHRAKMFGAEPSEVARKAVELFEREGVCKILEVGAGQGRDTV